jgi:hypothetical protein
VMKRTGLAIMMAKRILLSSPCNSSASIEGEKNVVSVFCIIFFISFPPGKKRPQSYGFRVWFPQRHTAESHAVRVDDIATGA